MVYTLVGEVRFDIKLKRYESLMSLILNISTEIGTEDDVEGFYVTQSDADFPKTNTSETYQNGTYSTVFNVSAKIYADDGVTPEEIAKHLWFYVTDGFDKTRAKVKIDKLKIKACRDAY